MAQGTTVLVRLLPYRVSGNEYTQLPGDSIGFPSLGKEFYIGKVQLNVPSTTSTAIHC